MLQVHGAPAAAMSDVLPKMCALKFNPPTLVLLYLDQRTSKKNLCFPQQPAGLLSPTRETPTSFNASTWHQKSYKVSNDCIRSLSDCFSRI